MNTKKIIHIDNKRTVELIALSIGLEAVHKGTWAELFKTKKYKKTQKVAVRATELGRESILKYHPDIPGYTRSLKSLPNSRRLRYHGTSWQHIVNTLKNDTWIVIYDPEEANNA